MEAGQALRGFGIPRSEAFITTKFSGLRDVDMSIQDSLCSFVGLVRTFFVFLIG